MRRYWMAGSVHLDLQVRAEMGGRYLAEARTVLASESALSASSVWVPLRQI